MDENEPLRHHASTLLIVLSLTKRHLVNIQQIHTAVIVDTSNTTGVPGTTVVSAHSRVDDMINREGQAQHSTET